MDNNMYTGQPMQPMNQGPSNPFGIISLVLGIVGLVVSFIGGICYGVFGGIFGILLGVGGIVLGIMAKKTANSSMATAGFVCGIIAVAFGFIFMVGCTACGCIESSETETSYTCYGVCGGSCMAAKDANDAVESLNNIRW